MAQRKRPSYTALLVFAKATAKLTKDRECQTCGRDEFDDNPECPKHRPFDLPSDDAVESLHILIAEARRLTAHKYISRESTY